MTRRFAAIGLDHGHIYGQVAALMAAGGELAGFATDKPELAAEFAARFPDAPRLDEAGILADPSITLITSAAIPVLRAEVAVRAMEAGKHVLLDKPGVVNRAGLASLVDAHRRTGCHVLAFYSELETNPAGLTALRLVREGAIGRLLHYNGTGPHRQDQGTPRPDWFWDRAQNGGILTDIASHQIAQFLIYSGATRGRISFARVACRGPRPDFQDLGEMLMECEGTAGRVEGYARVDWLTPRGMPVWGDGRIVLTGTEGVIEMRKYVDPAGQGVGAHLILTDARGPRRVDCTQTSTFASRLFSAIETGEDTPIPQSMAFHIMELCIEAQEIAEARAEVTA